MMALPNGRRTQRVEKLAIPELGRDAQHRLQHLRIDPVSGLEPPARQHARLLDQLFFFARAGYERNQLLAQQTRVLTIVRLRRPPQCYRLLAKFLANKAGALSTQIRRNALTPQQRGDVGGRLHHVPVRILAELRHQRQRRLRRNFSFAANESTSPKTPTRSATLRWLPRSIRTFFKRSSL